MAGEVITVQAGQRLPQYWDASIVIGGSMAAPGPSATSWPAEGIALLRERWTNAGRLVVFVPGPGGRLEEFATEEQASSLADAIEVADVAMFWWPDDQDERLMLASLMTWNDSRRVVHGAPLRALHARNLLRNADRRGFSAATTLSDLVSAALSMIGPGARRTGGEREVPLPVWRTESFQRWYSAQASAGNKLLSARQVWTFAAGAGRAPLIYWALHVQVHIASENRVKSNEVVISRPDISVMALYQHRDTLDDAVIVLVREFRSSASTPDGFVHELPGGSGAAGADFHAEAVRETADETGFAVDVRRIRAHGSRQLAATVSAHHAHLFTAELTSDELTRLRASQSTPRGAGDTEQTWTEITTFGEIRRNRLVDWATLGLIAEALLAEKN